VQVLPALFIWTFLRIYKFRSLQETPAKPAHLQLVPSAMDSVTSNHIFKRERKVEKRTKRRIVLNGGRERMELKELKKQGWSTSTYSGEVPEEMRWKTHALSHSRCLTRENTWRYVETPSEVPPIPSRQGDDCRTTTSGSRPRHSFRFSSCNRAVNF
jgi:hypothetical protein